jgi:hypothetical protein
MAAQVHARPAAKSEPRNKKAEVLAMMKRAKGATLAEIRRELGHPENRLRTERGTRKDRQNVERPGTIGSDLHLACIGIKPFAIVRPQQESGLRHYRGVQQRQTG